MHVLCNLIPYVLILVNLIFFDPVAWQFVIILTEELVSYYRTFFQSPWVIQWKMFKVTEGDNWIQNFEFVYNLRKEIILN